MTTTNAIITKTYNDNTVLLFREDGYFNMTKAAKAFGKELKHFWTRPDTIAMLQDMAGSNSADSAQLKAQFTDITVGRYHGGTWAHPELAVEFARWLDVKFARWCNAVIKDIMTGAAEVVVVKPEQSEIMKMPTSMLEAGRLWLQELERAETLQLENAKQPEVIAEQGEVIAIAAPKAEFYDAVMDTSKVYTPTEAANILGLDLYRSGKKVNELLVELGWQYKKLAEAVRSII